MLLQFAKYNFIIYHFIKPYEITLFSNKIKTSVLCRQVLLPYEITLFSNYAAATDNIARVLLPYEITLFSNVQVEFSGVSEFYYLMKLHYSQTNRAIYGDNFSFTTL